MDNTMRKNEKGLEFTRVFDAPRAKVWEAWTTPEMVKKWWGPKDFTAPHIEIDLREGGKYLYCMHGVVVPGGEAHDFWSAGIFREVKAPEKIVVTDYFSDEKGNPVTPAYYGMGSDVPYETTVETMLEEMGNKTKFTLRYPDTSRFDEQDLKDMDMGWNQSLDKLAEALK